jgi:aconitase A
MPVRFTSPVEAALAKGFERIRRSKSIGIGILPLKLPEHLDLAGLALRPGDRFDIFFDPAAITRRAEITVTIEHQDGRVAPMAAGAHRNHVVCLAQKRRRPTVHALQYCTRKRGVAV